LFLLFAKIQQVFYFFTDLEKFFNPVNQIISNKYLFILIINSKLFGTFSIFLLKGIIQGGVEVFQDIIKHFKLRC